MEIFNLIIAIGVVALQVWVAIMLYLLVFYKRFTGSPIILWHKRHSITLLALVSLAGVLGSLTYSQIIGFEPCVLCWWQRIFQYPLLVIFGMGAILKEKGRNIIAYGLPLALIGIGISTYHYLVQRLDSVTSSCDVLGQSASCAGYYVFEFGYITIPMMALTIFAVSIVLMIFAYKRNG